VVPRECLLSRARGEVWGESRVRGEVWGVGEGGGD
jgi:hypothetical protein